MPCRDFYDDHPEQFFKDVTEPALKKQIAFAESALCQTLAVLEYVVKTFTDDPDFYGFINYTEGGFTREELVDWHTRHKEADARARELSRLVFERSMQTLGIYSGVSDARELRPDEKQAIQAICNQESFRTQLEKNADKVPARVWLLITKYQSGQ